MVTLWHVEVYPITGDAYAWNYAAGTAAVAVGRVMRHGKVKSKEGQIYFRPSTKEEIERFREKHPDHKMFAVKTKKTGK